MNLWPASVGALVLFFPPRQSKVLQSVIEPSPLSAANALQVEEMVV